MRPSFTFKLRKKLQLPMLDWFFFDQKTPKKQLMNYEAKDGPSFNEQTCYSPGNIWLFLQTSYDNGRRLTLYNNVVHTLKTFSRTRQINLKEDHHSSSTKVQHMAADKTLNKSMGCYCISSFYELHWNVWRWDTTSGQCNCMTNYFGFIDKNDSPVQTLGFLKLSHRSAHMRVSRNNMLYTLSI